MVRETERRSRSCDRIHVRTGIVGIYHRRRSASLGHGLVVESPVLVPGDLHLAHEERRNRHLPDRRLILTAERFFFITSHPERTSRDSYHGNGSRSPRHSLGEVPESVHLGGGREYLSGTGVHLSSHLLVLVAFQEMSGIEVAAYAVQISCSLVVIVIEMGRYSVISDALGIEIDVASLARLVENGLPGVLQGLHLVPVYVRFLLCQESEDVGDSEAGLDGQMPEIPGRRKMALGAVGNGTAGIVVMHRLLPACLRIRMDMTGHAGGVRRSVLHKHVETNHACQEQDEPAQSHQEIFIILLLRHLHKFTFNFSQFIAKS